MTYNALFSKVFCSIITIFSRDSHMFHPELRATNKLQFCDDILELASLQLHLAFFSLFLKHGCTNPRRQFGVETQLFTTTHNILGGPQYGSCLMTPLWRLELYGRSLSCGQLVHPCLESILLRSFNWRCPACLF